MGKNRDYKMNKAIFLDRDGTIIEDKGYMYKTEDLDFLPKVIAGLKKLQDNEYSLIIITNQAGIGKGFFSESDYLSFRNFLHNELKKQGVSISAEYFCPHHLSSGLGKYRIDCDCRKPKTGMLEKAAKDFDLDLKECWMIGDKSSDMGAGKKAGCKTIHVLTGREKNPVSDSDFTAINLVEATKCILNHKNK